MALSLNEIRDRAFRFSNDHANDDYERGETQKFWIDFFELFGVDRRRLDFEKRVKINDSQKYVDVFLSGKVLVEHKSKGKNLDLAFEQARNYLRGLKTSELPKMILVSDFERFRIYDLNECADFYEFKIEELSQKIEYFNFLTGRQTVQMDEEDPVNLRASKLMGDLHDKLFEIGYSGHDLEIFLVRVLFCMFAEDTQIFESKQFENYIKNRTAEDGSDLGAKLDELFDVLNTKENDRLKIIDEELNAFPYVNGKLFAESIRKTAFNAEMREQILVCAEFDWSQISPAIFGSLFQYVMDKEKRRNLGAHYTDESNILKLIKPLFLDQLWDEFHKIKNMKRLRKEKMTAFHDKIAGLDFFDPACGCGNFLIITYREMRKLEIEILKVILEKELKQRSLFDVKEFIKLDVDKFHGIEIEEFSAKIAEVSMWLMDHLMNREAASEFAQAFARIPLKKSANIFFGNALCKDWQEVLSAQRCNFIIGNPPFYGKSLQTSEQKEDMEFVFGDTVKKWKSLDYVSAWYKKAADYINSPLAPLEEGGIKKVPLSEGDLGGASIEIGFVSTNSITQGEQVGILWKDLMENYGVKINFAHQTFKWSNQASGKAQVFVVIIGFALFDEKEKWLFEYDDVRGEPTRKKVKNINAYLVDAPNVFIEKRGKPVCDVPEIKFGSMPNDGGNFLFSTEEKKEFLKIEPQAEEFFRPLLSAREFLNGENRWCLWLKNANLQLLKQSPKVLERIQNVKENRMKSSRKTTKELASFPTLFGEDRQPESNFVLIPRHSSENRRYIPFGFFDKENVVSDSCSCVQNATLYHFGILTSQIHMAWVKYTCGRLKGDFRYSNQIVYNNFPWPNVETKTVETNCNSSLRGNIENLAQNILGIREKYADSSLADLYDPLTMPPDLLKAHQKLDLAVDRLYRKKPFESDAERVGFLFGVYEGIVKGNTDNVLIPTIIDLDEIKKEIPGYSPEKADEFHSFSAKIGNKIFDTRLKELKNTNSTIVLMCGGSASGKSEFLAKYLPNDFNGIIFDSTLSTKEGAKNKIRNIKKSGNIPIICLILPKELTRSFTAFNNRERKIPEHRFYETHSGARKVVFWIAKEFPEIEILVYENKYDPKEKEEEALPYQVLSFDSNEDLIEFLEKIQYNKEEIYNILQENEKN